MGNYTTGTCATAESLLSNISTFLTSNGWTVDLTSSTRLHVHKAEAHVEFWLSGNEFYTMACTGYDSGLSSALQPGGASSLSYLQLVFNSKLLSFVFVSTANAFYMSVQKNSSYPYRSLQGVGTIVDKLGAWTGGLFFAGGNTWASDYSSLFEVEQNVSVRMLVNGVWSSSTINAPMAATGGLDVLVSLWPKQPNVYNAGILPQPIFIFQRDSLAASMLHPLGYFPDVMAFYGGSVYAEGELITINNDMWVVSAMSPAEMVVPYLLFKVGA